MKKIQATIFSDNAPTATETVANVYALKSDLSIYGKEIILGIDDSPDNWKLIEEPIEEPQLIENFGGVIESKL